MAFNGIGGGDKHDGSLLFKCKWHIEANDRNVNADRNWSGRRDSNPRPRPWQGRALPLSYARLAVRGMGLTPLNGALIA
jgi:hypothetical protein